MFTTLALLNAPWPKECVLSININMIVSGVASFITTDEQLK